MQWLDVKTILLSYGVINVVSVLVIAQIWHQNRKRFAGLSHWLLCYALQIAGGILVGLRGYAPGFVTIVLANACLIGGISALCAGLAQFTGQPWIVRANALILAGFVGLMSYFTSIHPAFAMRVILHSMALLLITLPCSWLLLRRVEPRLRSVTRFVGFVLLGYAFTALARIAAVSFNSFPDTLFSLQLSNTLGILSYQLLNVILTFALILMINRRLFLELQTQQATLQSSEEKFAKAFHASPDAILISRISDGRIIEVNEGFLRLSGYTREETFTSSSLVPSLWANPHDREKWEAALQERQSLREQEYDFRSKSGGIVHGLYTGEPIRLGTEDCVLSVIRDITARQRTENILTFLAQCTATPQENFFQALARYLAENLNVDYVCIDRLEGDHLTAHTVAIYVDGKFEDNMTYALQDTPCGKVVGKAVCCFPSGVRRLFPRDLVLQEMEAESYVGVTLWSYSGRPIGLIAVIGRQPMTNTDLAESLLKLAAVRAAGELERRQAEEVLRESEEKFYNVFHFNPVAMSLSTLTEGRFLDVNTEFLRLTERSREEVIGHTSLEIQAWRTSGQRDQIITRLREHGAARDIEVEVRAKSGKLLQVLWSAEIVAVKDEPLLLASAKDITDRKQAELALKLNEQRLEALLKLSQMMECSEQELADFALEEAVRLTESAIGYLHYVHEDQVNLSLFSWSKATLNICSASKNGHYPLSEAGVWADCVRERRPVIHNDYPALLEKKGLPAGHVPLIRHMSIPVFDGERIVAIAGVGNKAQPYNDADVRQLSLFMANLWHIFRRKRAEEALRESDLRLRETQTIAQLGEWELDLTANALFWSEEIYRIFDLDPGKFTPSYETFLDIVHPEDRAMVNQAYLDSVKTRMPYEIVHRLRLADGSIKFVRELCRTEYNPEGKPVRSIGAVQDITALKRVEEELRAAKAEADAANQAKSDFLAHISHELRTPLNGILGYAQILQRDQALSDDQRRSAAIIEQSGQHLLNLINDLLDLAKIEAGKLDLADAEFHLLACLHGIKDLLKVKTEQKGLRFVLEASETLPAVVRGDEHRLRQVLLNLLGNAVKFTEHGQVTLRVARLGIESTSRRQQSQQAPHARLQFSISDTGIGMTPEEAAQIFQPFQQAGTVQYRRQGTGLGLAISRRLVDLMGGSLHVASQREQGSTFWFEIDLPEIEAAGEPVDRAARVIVGLEGDAPTILVVDDDPTNRAVLVRLLASLGFRLLEAANGHEALTQAARQRPDLIITDLRMPEMDGVTLIRRLQQTPELAAIAVIMTSASAYASDRERSLAAGSQAFLPKPLDMDLLLDALQQALNLTWRYQTPADVSAAAVNADEWRLPPAATLNTLRACAQIGDILGIRACLSELQKADARFHSFVQKLQPLARDMQVGRIEKLMTEYLSQ